VNSSVAEVPECGMEITEIAQSAMSKAAVTLVG
jgi:hypothetical protein